MSESSKDYGDCIETVWGASGLSLPCVPHLVVDYCPAMLQVIEELTQLRACIYGRMPPFDAAGNEAWDPLELGDEQTRFNLWLTPKNREYFISSPHLQVDPYLILDCNADIGRLHIFLEAFSSYEREAFQTLARLRHLFHWLWLPSSPDKDLALVIPGEGEYAILKRISVWAREQSLRQGQVTISEGTHHFHFGTTVAFVS